MRILSPLFALASLLVARASSAQPADPVPGDDEPDPAPAAQPAPEPKAAPAEPPKAAPAADDYAGPAAVTMVNTAGSSPRVAGTGDGGSRGGGQQRSGLSPYTGPESSAVWDWQLSGFIRAPMRIGMSRREDPAEGQHTTTFHSPVIPDDQQLSWQHTNHNPRDWAELFVSVGNETASGTLSIEGFNFTNAGFKEDGAQFGIAQGFATLNLGLGAEWAKLRLRAGAFTDRYGMAGIYDAGEYDTYLFGRTHAMGASAKVDLDYEKWTFSLTHGIGATRPNPSSGNYARFTLLNHAHFSVLYDKQFEAGFHYLTSAAQEEDRIGETNLPGAKDGQMTVIGPEARFDGRQFGYYYGGFSYISAEDALVVGPSIEVIHAKGANEFNLGIVQNYLDDRRGTPSLGNGKVYTFLVQFEHSIQRILAGNKPFWGDDMDLYLKLYSMVNFIESQDPDVDGNVKAKYGADLNFRALPWLSVATRYDRLQPHSEIPEQSFSILSPRIELRSEFVSHEKISFQYSRYFYNQRECPQPGSRLCAQTPAAAVLPEGFGATTGNQETAGNRGAPTMIPDENVFTITATFWW